MNEVTPRPRIAFVTQLATPRGCDDDRLAQAALEHAGVQVLQVPWDGEGTRWETFDAVVIRSPWNYHEAPESFASWLKELEGCGARVWNPVEVLRWNMHKRYLRELEAKGIPIVPTHWVPQGNTVDLMRLLERRSWEQAVVKPAVSAGARDTFRVHWLEAARYQARLNAMSLQGEVMIQPFLPEVLQGEWGVVFFGRQFSHALLKKPKDGDFRVQPQFGGLTDVVPPPQAVLEGAQRALSHVPADLLYARVDGFLLEGVFHLMELEVLEPNLFFERAPQAAKAFTRAILERIPALV